MVENTKLEKKAKIKACKLNLEFEYTGKSTPQRDHVSKVGLSNIRGRGHAMMSNSNVSLKIRYKV